MILKFARDRPSPQLEAVLLTLGDATLFLKLDFGIDDAGLSADNGTLDNLNSVVPEQKALAI